MERRRRRTGRAPRARPGRDARPRTRCLRGRSGSREWEAVVDPRSSSALWVRLLVRRLGRVADLVRQREGVGVGGALVGRDGLLVLVVRVLPLLLGHPDLAVELGKRVVL